jgi:ATP-binding cassette subfamily C protein
MATRLGSEIVISIQRKIETITKDFEGIFSAVEKRKLIGATILQSSLAVLDLIGVALIGVIGALSIYGIQSKSDSGRASRITTYLHLDNFSFQRQIAVLGGLAAVILVLKTVSSLVVARKVLNFVSSKGALVTKKLLQTVLNNPSWYLSRYTQQEIIYACTTGVQNLTTGIIGTASTMFSDSILLLVMFLGLFVVNPILAISTLVVFSAVGLVMHATMRTKAFALGTQESKLNIQGNELIWEALNTYRESIVRNTQSHYVDGISQIRHGVANAITKKNLMPYVGKYVMEIAMVLGGLILTAIQFVLYDATTAIASLTIFLAATSRIAPAVLRIQQGVLLIRNLRGTTGVTTALLKMPSRVIPKIDSIPSFNHHGFSGLINVDSLEFAYGPSSQFRIDNLNLQIHPGTHVAIVGPSGSGKSTLVDLILGSLEPTSGEIYISGKTPKESFLEWPGSTAYVPQKVSISNVSLRENICLGYPAEFFDEAQISDVLQKTGLMDLVNNEPEGLDFIAGDHGSKLSGGQQQRLGIARALITNPRLIVLDEATSSLDSVTEFEITKAISLLRGKTTVITIAHRLSTVREADVVIYLEDGNIVASGTFEEVRSRVPNFEKQAHLMGIQS